jgi:hypothetical protein
MDRIFMTTISLLRPVPQIVLLLRFGKKHQERTKIVHHPLISDSRRHSDSRGGSCASRAMLSAPQQRIRAHLSHFLGGATPTENLVRVEG